MKNKIFVFLLVAVVSSAGGFFANQFLSKSNPELITPFVSFQESISYPLLEYSINNLKTREYLPSKLKIESLIAKEDLYDSYVFSYTTLGKKMTGQINIPDKITASPAQKHSAIVMIRGYVPAEVYETGIGTKNAANILANNGYITLAPDFFGYGNSDPEPENSWQTRFEKPIIIIELLKSLEENGVPVDIEEENDAENLKLNSKIKKSTPEYKIDNFGIWAHSNGGQIALTTLEVLDQEIPTTLWAPVTAPFPYSVLYFGDELEDEGKSQRKWIAMFEKKYDVFEFSLTKRLNLLQGPIQIHHGNADDAALIYWSEEFVDKIEVENSNREATVSAKIDLTFYKYENTNHNMSPNWDKVISRDIQFFNKHLVKP